MQCPRCHVELRPTERHKILVNLCPQCQGMWLDHEELYQLEDEVFDFGEHAKGTLIADSRATQDACPVCGQKLQRFRYRFYDMEMEFCEREHGYWLEADEDTRVLELMKQEEQHLQRKLLAEDKWTRMLRQMRSGSFLDKLRGLFR